MATRCLGSVAGKAHGRQLAMDSRRAWSRELTSRHPADLVAPHRLWTMAVGLVTHHDGAYLEHCRLHGERAA